MQSLDIDKSINGFNVRGEFLFDGEKSQFKLMLDMFIPNNTDIDTIQSSLFQLILDNNYTLSESTKRSCNTYSRAIFHNIKGLYTKSDKQDIAKQGSVSPITEIYDIIRSHKYEETSYHIESEIRLPVGRRADIQKYINILVLIMSQLDIKAIQSLTYVDTDIVIMCRYRLDPKNEEDALEASMSLVKIIRERVYKELEDSLRNAQELADKLIKNEDASALLNQIFERRTGFTVIKDIKRIKDDRFEELVKQLYEILETL